MVWSEEDHISTVIQSRSIDSVLAHEIAQLASLAIMLKLNAEKRYKKSLSDFYTTYNCTLYDRFHLFTMVSKFRMYRNQKFTDQMLLGFSKFLGHCFVSLK